MDDLEIRMKLLGEAESAIKALLDTEKASDRLENKTEKLGKTAKTTSKDIEDLGDKASKSESFLLKGAKGAGGFAKNIGLISAAIGVLSSIAAGFSIASTFDATDELRELQMGVKTLDDLSDGALALNANMSELDISKIIAVNDQWQQQKDHLTELSGMLTNSLSPIMHGVMGEFEKGWSDLGITQDDVTNGIITGLGFVLDIIDTGKMVLKEMEIAYLILGESGTAALVGLGDVGAKLANVTLGAIIRAIGEAIGGFREMAKTSGNILSNVPGMFLAGKALSAIGSASDETINNLKNYQITVDSISATHQNFVGDLEDARIELAQMELLPSGAKRVTAWYKEQEAALKKVAIAQQALRKAQAKSSPRAIAAAKKAVALAKAQARAIKKIADAKAKALKPYNDEIAALTDTNKKLKLNERAYYITTLQVKKFTDKQIEAALAIWDQNEALSAQKESVSELSDNMDSWFNNLFENGASAFDDLWDSAQSFFRNLAAQMSRKWVLRLVGIGSASVSGIAQAGGVGGVGSSSGGLGSIGSLMSSHSIGETLALTEYNVLGTDLLGGAAGYSNLAYGGVGLVAGLIGDELFGGEGGTGSSLGSMGAMALGLGPVGIILGGLLGGALGGLFGDKKTVTANFREMPNEAAAWGGVDGALIDRNTTGQAFYRESDLGSFGLGIGTVALNRDTPGQIEGIQAMFDSLVILDNQIASFLTDDEISRVEENLKAFTGNALDAENMTIDRLKTIFEAIPNELANLVDLEAPIEDIVNEIAELSAINTQLLPTMQAMGFEFDEVNSMAIATVHGLAEANGGLEAFANSLQSFYSVSMNFAGDIESLKMRLMEDDEARYDYLKAQSDELVAQLQTATDIDTITLLSEQIRQLTNQGLEYLTEDQIQNGMGAEQLAFYEDIQQLGSDRLQAAIDAQAENVDTSANTQVQDVAAASLEASANIFGQASNTILDAATVISSAATSFGSLMGTTATPPIYNFQSELGLAQ